VCVCVSVHASKDLLAWGDRVSILKEMRSDCLSQMQIRVYEYVDVYMYTYVYIYVYNFLHILTHT